MSRGTAVPRWIWIALVASVSLTLVAVWMLLQPRSLQLDDLGAMPAFELTNQEGKRVSSSDLHNKALLISLIYTNCTDVCPLTTSAMRRAQQALAAKQLLGSRAMLLSITVDPERDTPAVLARYAAKYQADTTTWHFLTGKPDELRQIVSEGFMLGYNKAAAAQNQNSYEVVHSDRLILVDRSGRMRAAYPIASLDLQALVATISELP